jgi:hypothetical protein
MVCGFAGYAFGGVSIFLIELDFFIIYFLLYS